VAHDTLSIPSTPDSITPEWLTGAMRLSGALEYAHAVSIAVTPVAAGSGFVGQAARLQIEYDREEQGAPSSVFAKLSSADSAVREQFRKVGLYETEAGFYRDVAAATLPVRVPRAYVSLYDDATSASILLIEDLSDARFGDNAAGLGPAEARIAVRQLARLHAHFWESPLLGRLPWLRSSTDNLESSVALARAALPRFEAHCGEFLSPGLLLAARAFVDRLPAYLDQYSDGPHTLTHGDFRADNFAFTRSGEEDFVLFDWQVARRSHGARDLAYLLGGSMDTQLRRDMEESLLHLYHETLLANGVKNYSERQLARDFRRGLGALLTVMIPAG
jgi:hypothetical protein